MCFAAIRSRVVYVSSLKTSEEQVPSCPIKGSQQYVDLKNVYKPFFTVTLKTDLRKTRY